MTFRDSTWPAKLPWTRKILRRRGRFGYGIVHAYFEKRLSPKIQEFASFDDACQSAQDQSIDPVEQEKASFVYRGREECLAIYRDGKTI